MLSSSTVDLAIRAPPQRPWLDVNSLQYRSFAFTEEEDHVLTAILVP